MKKLFFFLSVGICCLSVQSQQNVGIGTTSPHASAILHLSSSDKGLLITRMSSSDRLAIATPANGLMVFDADIQNFWYYDSVATVWREINAAAGNLPSGSFANTLRHDGSNWVADNLLTNNGNRIGIGIASPSEGFHSDSSVKIGNAVWSSSANSKFLKFGDGNFISVGEDSADDRLYLRAKDFIFGKSSAAYTGNVGIGVTGTPTAKLQVNGTVRITDGTQLAGRVLTSDANGNASWQEASCMQHRTVYGTPGSGFVFTVPAGVTKLFIEEWGGGGSGSVFTSTPGLQINGGGGGSGGYANYYLDVLPAATLAITIGSVTGGLNTSVSYAGNLVSVNNGGNADNILGPGVGGTLGASSFANVFFIRGNPGVFNLNTVYTISATTYTEYRGGKGGDAPHGGGSGGMGEIARSGYNSGSDFGSFPGGGGGASTSSGTTIKAGAGGAVMVHY
jgi:hypothetical protein